MLHSIVSSSTVGFALSLSCLNLNFEVSNSVNQKWCVKLCEIEKVQPNKGFVTCTCLHHHGMIEGQVHIGTKICKGERVNLDNKQGRWSWSIVIDFRHLLVNTWCYYALNVSQPFHWMNHLCTLNSALYHLFTFSYSHAFPCLQVIFATCRSFQRCFSCYYPSRNRIWWMLEIYMYFCVQKLDTAVVNLPVVRLWNFINSPVSMDVGFSVCAYVVLVKVYVVFGWCVGIWWLSAGLQAVVNTTWILLIFKYPVFCCISALYLV